MSRKPARTATQRARDILEALAEIRLFVTGLDFSRFSSDAKTLKAVLANFAIMGEAASHIPEETTASYPQIPWPQLRGMRNIVVHVYFAVEPRIVWDTIQSDLDSLENQLRRVLNDLDDFPTPEDSL